MHLLIKANTTDLNWPAGSLASSSTTESWTEQIVTIPSGATTLQAGVVWNTVTAGQIFYLNDFSIEKISAGTPEYQYHLKDHLGNVRVTFTTKDETLNYTATFENSTQTTEQATFRNYTRVTNDLFDHTDAGTASDKVQLLNDGNNSQVGISKSFAVMPGDVITAQVYAKHYGATGSAGNLAGFASALLSAFGLPAPVAGETGTASAAIQSYGTFIAGGGNPGNPAWTKGFLNVLIFDKNYNLVDLAYQQLDAAYVQPVGSSTKMPHQLLTQTKTIKEPGYVYIYVSNEGSVQKDIYFDDMTVTHTKSKVIQADDYYPFGLAFNSYQRENSVENKYTYNGKELQDELDLGWLDFGKRMYDAALGRWPVVDPLSEKRYWMNPYNFVQNNPLNRIDPNGLTDFTVNKETGEVRRVGNANDQPDRIVKTDRHGNVKRKGEGFLGSLVRESKRGEAKVAVGGIQQGILRDGANFQNNNNVIAVGGDGQPTVAGVRDFALKLSNYVGKEMSGYYLSNNGENRTSHVYISNYANNGAQHAQGGLRLDLARPDLVGRVHPTVDWHTHLSRFGDESRLVPSGLTLPGGDIAHKRNQLRNNPDLRFIIITNPTSTDQRATEIEY